MSKRSLLANMMQRSGITRIMESLPKKPGILILNHHRIGDKAQTRFDREVFSASCDQLDSQLRYVKQRFPIVGGEELDALVHSAKPLRHLHVAFTFDDGYRDNYTNAFDIFHGHGVPGHFFLVPTYVGSDTIPWWDAIAFYVRHTPRSQLSLPLPTPLIVPITGDREAAILTVLRHYKRPDNVDGEAFLDALKSQAEVELPVAGRRFLSWEEAAEMQAGGMTIGSHTLTHRILSQLTEAEQEHELRSSRQLLQQHLGSAITSIAYPVGAASSFTAATRRLATEAGYRVCLSFYGGINAAQGLDGTDVLRTSIDPDPLMFRNEVSLLSSMGRLPY